MHYDVWLVFITDPLPNSMHFPVGRASNDWVVSCARSGRPLLANDPHAPAQRTIPLRISPILRLLSPGAAALDVVRTTCGTPLIVLGRSDAIAWGFATTGADVQDLFIEKIDPSNLSEYLTPQGWRRFQEETMAIHVREVAHGLSTFNNHHNHAAGLRRFGAMLDEGYVAALQWTALSNNDTTFAAQIHQSASPERRQLHEQDAPLRRSHAEHGRRRHRGEHRLITGRVPVRNASDAISRAAHTIPVRIRPMTGTAVRFDQLPHCRRPTSRCHRHIQHPHRRI